MSAGSAIAGFARLPSFIRRQSKPFRGGSFYAAARQDERAVDHRQTKLEILKSHRNFRAAGDKGLGALIGELFGKFGERCTSGVQFAPLLNRINRFHTSFLQGRAQVDAAKPVTLEPDVVKSRLSTSIRRQNANAARLRKLSPYGGARFVNNMQKRYRCGSANFVGIGVGRVAGHRQDVCARPFKIASGGDKRRRARRPGARETCISVGGLRIVVNQQANVILFAFYACVGEYLSEEIVSGFRTDPADNANNFFQHGGVSFIAVGAEDGVRARRALERYGRHYAFHR